VLVAASFALGHRAKSRSNAMAGTWSFAVCLAALAVVWADEPTGSEPPPICQDHAINLTASEGRITSRPLFGGSSCCPTRQLRQNGYHSTGIACFWMLDNPPSGDFEVRFNLSGSRFSPGDALVFQAAWGRELGRIDGMPIHPFLISMPAHSANLGIRLQATSNQTTLKLHYRLRSVVRPDAADDDDEGVVDNCQGSPTLANPSCRQWDTDPIVRALPVGPMMLALLFLVLLMMGEACCNLPNASVASDG